MNAGNNNSPGVNTKERRARSYPTPAMNRRMRLGAGFSNGNCTDGSSVQVCGVTRADYAHWAIAPGTVRIVCGMLLVGPFRYISQGALTGEIDTILIEPICECGGMDFIFADSCGNDIAPESGVDFYISLRILSRFTCFMICVGNNDMSPDGEGGACMCVCVSLRVMPELEMPKTPPAMIYPPLVPPTLPPVQQCINLPPTIVPPEQPATPPPIRMPTPVLFAPLNPLNPPVCEEPPPVILPQQPAPPAPPRQVNRAPILMSPQTVPPYKMPRNPVPPAPIVVTPPPMPRQPAPPPARTPILRPLETPQRPAIPPMPCPPPNLRRPGIPPPQMP